MYASFFGLKHEPFSIAPDPRYLFMSERHREALAHLLYGVKGGGGGFVLLTGEIGAGKTTVCRCLMEQIPKRCNVAYIFNPKLTALELLKTVCDEFHVPYAHEGAGHPTVKDYLDPLNDFLLKTHAIGRNNVLIIDEAQNLSADVLEQLRLLTNLETNQRKLLQIVLIGQPELRAMLARPELEQLAQRVIARYHLGALTETETRQYLRHRLTVAGLATANPFSKRAMQRIHQRARGVPRRINLLADRALLGAYADGVARIDKGIVDKAAAEVFGADERLQCLRRLAPWGIGLAVGAALAATGTLWLTRSSPVTAPSALDVAKPAAASANALPSPSTAAQAATLPTTAPASATGAVPPSPAATRTSGASGAVVAAAAAPVFITATDLNTRFANPLRREADAWRELASLWPALGAQANAAEPCAPAPPSNWQCFKSVNAGLPLIRQLDRPGIVTLRDDAGRPVYALLVAIDERSATLRMGGQRLAVALVSLANLWQGDFATYWQAPEGYQRPLGDRDAGALVDKLASQLAVLRGEAPPAGAQRFDAGMRSRVLAFQLAQGLRPDGVAGPTTYMQLARAAGAANEPRLAGGAR
jgi:general secretion pathway protein A